MDLEAISYLKIYHGSIFKKEIRENENSARPRCDFIYTKNSARPRSDFIYTKNFQEGRCDSCLTVSVLRVRFLCGNRWGRSWRKWQFPSRKTRCAVMMIFHDFSWLFLWFFMIFHDFLMIFHSFSIIFQNFLCFFMIFHNFSTIFRFSYVFSWFFGKNIEIIEKSSHLLCEMEIPF